jgi:DNA-binding winged helix-turn-helix (wHTH) protein
MMQDAELIDRPAAARAVRRTKFGAFEADPRSGELVKNGRRVRLQEQPFQLLSALLERPGELVTREELRTLLWPQTVVDYDHGLNKAVSKIREALGDSAESPRFVETVARRGYRFLADVTVVIDGSAVHEPDPPPPVLEAVAPAPPVIRRRRNLFVSIGLLLLLAVALLVWLSPRHQDAQTIHSLAVLSV